MTPIWIWIRSGWAIPVGLAVFGAFASTVALDWSWRLESDWGLRLVSAAVTFVAPIVAAAAAYETAKRHRPTIAAHANAGVRRQLAHLIPAASIAAVATAALVLVWAGVLVAVRLSDGTKVLDGWVFPETLFPIWGAVTVGALIGYLIEGVAAPIVTAIAVFGTAIAASPWGRGPFDVVTTYGSLIGLERPADQAITRALAALGIAVVCGVAAVAAATWASRRAIIVLSAALLIPLVFGPALWPWSEQVARPSREPVGCVGAAPALCGPQSHLPLLARAQPRFAEAYERLAGTQFTTPDRYSVTRLGAYSRLDGAAPLDFDSGPLTRGSYPTAKVADALLRPHQCSGLYDAQGAAPILEAQERVDPWLTAVIDGRLSALPVPGDVATAFAVIESCDVVTGDRQ